MATIGGVPQAQMAYQSILQTKMQAAWAPYAQTANRYGAGDTTQTPWTQAGMVGGPVMAPGGGGGGRARLFIPVGGQAFAVVASGGASYAANDTVTFTAVNGGRPIKIKILTVTAGAPTTMQILDPGSGLVFGGDGKNNYNGTPPTPLTITQASTSGSGSGATWSVTGANGWDYPTPLPTS